MIVTYFNIFLKETESNPACSIPSTSHEILENLPVGEVPVLHIPEDFSSDRGSDYSNSDVDSPSSLATIKTDGKKPVQLSEIEKTNLVSSLRSEALKRTNSFKAASRRKCLKASTVAKDKILKSARIEHV